MQFEDTTIQWSRRIHLHHGNCAAAAVNTFPFVFAERTALFQVDQAPSVDSQTTPYRRTGEECAAADAARSAAQSPRGPPQPKAGVFKSIISPVLTLFQGKPDGDDGQSVVLEVRPQVQCMLTLALLLLRLSKIKSSPGMALILLHE